MMWGADALSARHFDGDRTSGPAVFSEPHAFAKSVFHRANLCASRPPHAKMMPGLAKPSIQLFGNEWADLRRDQLCAHFVTPASPRGQSCRIWPWASCRSRRTNDMPRRSFEDGGQGSSAQTPCFGPEFWCGSGRKTVEQPLGSEPLCTDLGRLGVQALTCSGHSARHHHESLCAGRANFPGHGQPNFSDGMRPALKIRRSRCGLGCNDIGSAGPRGVEQRGERQGTDHGSLGLRGIGRSACTGSGRLFAPRPCASLELQMQFHRSRHRTGHRRYLRP